MKLYYLPRTAIEAEILYQALYVHVQRLNTSLTKCQTRYCMEPRPSVDDCKVMRFLKRLSGKTSNKMFLLLLILLADCCILFTITIKKTKCSTALSAPIFSPLLFCLSGVFPLKRFKNRTCIIRAAKRISAAIAVRGRE